MYVIKRMLHTSSHTVNVVVVMVLMVTTCSLCRMQYQDGSCTWNDYKTQFSIERQALRIYVPIQANGQIGCNEGPLFPR